MKKHLLILAICSVSTSALAQVYHQGYYTKNGTYVEPHYQSAPDSNPYNNYSSQGNVNPFTGQPGTVNPNNQYNNGSGAFGGGGAFDPGNGQFNGGGTFQPGG